MTQRIRDFVATRRPDGPCLVVDLDVIKDNYKAFRHALPDSMIYYAVKANPAPEILKLLASMGSNFDCASVAEIEMALDAGATPARVSFGNTIKKERDVARAHALGISLFAVDSHEEVEKIARSAPGARVFCRRRNGPQYLPGTVKELEGNRLRVAFDDGVEEWLPVGLVRVEK